MSAAGFPTPDSSGNGTPPRANPVSTTPLYEECRAWIEAHYPRLEQERFFVQLEAYMVVCEVEDDARQVNGSSTWILTTPDDFSPFLTIYFTYRAGQVVLQAVWADD